MNFSRLVASFICTHNNQPFIDTFKRNFGIYFSNLLKILHQIAFRCLQKHFPIYLHNFDPHFKNTKCKEKPENYGNARLEMKYKNAASSEAFRLSLTRKTRESEALCLCNSCYNAVVQC